jgi:hypothetical protein
MKDSIYLLFTKHRVTGHRRTNPPTLRPGEFMVKLHVEVPPSFFDKAIPQARLKVTEDSIVQGPIEVETEPVEQPQGGHAVQLLPDGSVQDSWNAAERR